jgi:hypothetical protein
MEVRSLHQPTESRTVKLSPLTYLSLMEGSDVEWLLKEASWQEFYWAIDQTLGIEFWNTKREELERVTNH